MGLLQLANRLSSLSRCESHKGWITRRVWSHINHAVTHVQDHSKSRSSHHCMLMQCKRQKLATVVFRLIPQDSSYFFYLASKSLLIIFRDVCSNVRPPFVALAQQCSTAPASDLCVGGIQLFPLSEPLVATCCEPYTANVHTHNSFCVFIPARSAHSAQGISAIICMNIAVRKHYDKKSLPPTVESKLWLGG